MAKQLVLLALGGIAIVAVVTIGGYLLGRDSGTPLFNDSDAPLIADETNETNESAEDHPDRPEQDDTEYLPTIPPHELPTV